MTKRAKLTDAEIDSHKVTLTIHLNTAAGLIEKEDYRGAKLALDMAVPHANAINNREYKSKVFGYLNTVRARIRKQSTIPAAKPLSELIGQF